MRVCRCFVCGQVCGMCECWCGIVVEGFEFSVCECECEGLSNGCVVFEVYVLVCDFCEYVVSDVYLVVFGHL